MMVTSPYYRLLRACLGEIVFPYDQVVFRRRDFSWQQKVNFLLGRLEARLHRGKPYSYPLGLQLEPTINCQLSCPYCPRTLTQKDRGDTDMSWEQYVRLMEEVGPYLIAIAFWQWGEPLQHPHISDMIRLAHSYGIITIMSTNGQKNMDGFDMDDLLTSGLDLLIVSMDGFRQTTYADFRSGGDVEKVKDFVQTFSQRKASLALKTPLINVRMIASSANESECDQVCQFAREAGADAFSVKSISLYYDADPLNPILPENRDLRSYQYQGQQESQAYQALPNLCRKPWSWPCLRYDGTLLMCECDHYMQHSLGNVFKEQSFQSVWQGEKAREIRKHFTSGGNIDLEFCQRCRYKLGDAIRRFDMLK